MVCKIIEDKRRMFREMKEKDPHGYQNILDYECPDDYCLPSFMDTHTCNKHTCEQCWEEALRE